MRVLRRMREDSDSGRHWLVEDVLGARTEVGALSGRRMRRKDEFRGGGGRGSGYRRREAIIEMETGSVTKSSACSGKLDLKPFGCNWVVAGGRARPEGRG